MNNASILTDTFGMLRSLDMTSFMFEQRTIFLYGNIDTNMASTVTTQLIVLETLSPGTEITMYINTTGGSVPDGLAICDTMNAITSPVKTIAIGTAASMGAIILASGTKGKRHALPSAQIMIHQPLLTGMQGQVSDIIIHTKQAVSIKERIDSCLASSTGKTLEEISIATERDNFMTAEQAECFGLIDSVVEKI